MKKAILLCAVLCAAAVAVADNDDEGLSAKEKADLLEKLKPSMVVAEFTLKVDKGESPGGRYGSSSWIREERPREIPGYLLAPDQAIIYDPMIHPRFVKGVAVRFGDDLVKAKISAYGRKETAAFLKLDRPLTKAKPLVFDSEDEKPALGIHHYRDNGRWSHMVSSVGRTVVVDGAGKRYVPSRPNALIADEKGKLMGINMTGYLAIDGSWKGSPLKWPVVTAKQMSQLLDRTKAVVEKGLLRVRLNFRSPKKGAGGGRFRRYMGDDEEESSTERNVLGAIIKDTQVLVLAQLAPKVTARLEKVTVYPAKGKPVEAKFQHTLTDYGAFLAKLARPVAGAVKLAKGELFPFEDRAVPAADVRLHGEKREVYYSHTRIARFDLGWRRHVYPMAGGTGERMFVFDAKGTLLALPVSRRQKVTVQQRWGGADRALTASKYLVEVFADLAANVDASNVPLTEEEEERLAWIGLVMQPLGRELARVNKVSHLTGDGRFGAMVSYVYPDSPAAKAGIEPGYILIRLHVEGEPKPLEVRLEEFGFGGRAFPWEQLDQVPAEMFDRIPTPWPAAENNFTRRLTDLGFGKKFAAEFFHDGKIVKKDFKVVQSPPHFGSAPKCKSEPLGMTVRDLTYEVKRYFQKTDKDPGVIVSKVEPGSKAAVSGIRPYEIITHINDKPIMNVKDFEKAIAAAGELRFAVKRMTRGRVVKIKMEAPKKAD